MRYDKITKIKFWKHNFQKSVEIFIPLKASDICQAVDGSINRVVVMDYILHGSLEKYLSITPINPKMGLKLCYTLAKGVEFLHQEVNGQKGKESVAHRDLSNTSVMVSVLILRIIEISIKS